MIYSFRVQTMLSCGTITVKPTWTCLGEAGIKKNQQDPQQGLETAQRKTPLAAKNLPYKHFSDTRGSLLSSDIL